MFFDDLVPAELTLTVITNPLAVIYSIIFLFFLFVHYMLAAVHVFVACYLCLCQQQAAEALCSVVVRPTYVCCPSVDTAFT